MSDKRKWRLVSYGMRENPGIWDTGNGAIKSIEWNPRYPGLERVTIKSYCGRDHDNCEFFRLARNADKTFPTLADAIRFMHRRHEAYIFGEEEKR